MYSDLELHDPHTHFHQQRNDHHQRGNNEAVDHGPDAGLLHAGEGGVQTDSGQGADHQELAGGLGSAHHLRGDGKDARHDGHGQEAQDEPGEDLPDGELGLEPAAILLECHGFLAFEVQLHKGEHDHRGDDRQRAGQLDHGGEIARRLGEGVAGGYHGGGIVHRCACPDAECLIRHAQRTAHDGEKHDHRHVKQEGGRHGVGHVVVIRVDGGSDGSNGRAAADARTGGNQVGQLPVQPQRLANEVAAAKAGQQGKDHHRQGHSPHMQDGGDVQRQAQQDDSELQYLLGGELQSGSKHVRLAYKLVEEHTDEHGDDRRADQVDGQQALQPAGQQRHDDRQHNAGKQLHDLHGESPLV